MKGKPQSRIRFLDFPSSFILHPFEVLSRLAVPNHLRRVTHLAKFFEDGVDAGGTDQQNAIGESPSDLGGEFLAGENFLRQYRILGEDETNAAMQFHR